MEEYVNVSLDFSRFVAKIVDVRVPRSMTMKTCLQLMSDSYGLGLVIHNPSLRVAQTGEVLFSTTEFEKVRNGACLCLETV